MDKLRLETLAVRVVEWHNRHPLARRIKVQHVQSIGYVALPFRVDGADGADGADGKSGAGVAAAVVPQDVAAPGVTLRERAMARAQQPAAAPAPAAASSAPAAGPRRLQAGFSEDFLAPIRLPRVARWALRHGREITIEPLDAPVRHVVVDGDAARVRLYAMTALIETAGRRSRVLVGPGDQPAILGRRLWSPQRLLALAVGVGVLAGVAWLVLSGLVTAPSSSPTQTQTQPPTAAASAASAAPGVPAWPASQAAALATAQLAASAAPRVEAAPVYAEPQLGRIELPVPKLPHGDAARNAAREPSGLRADGAASAAAAPGGASAAAAKPSSTTAEPAPNSPAMTAAATPGTPIFAVSTRIMRTRAESEQVMVAMQALLATTGTRDVRVEIVPSGADWRVVVWPFAHREDAERARALLASRGMRVAVVDF